MPVFFKPLQEIYNPFFGYIRKGNTLWIYKFLLFQELNQQGECVTVSQYRILGNATFYWQICAKKSVRYLEKSVGFIIILLFQY